VDRAGRCHDDDRPVTLAQERDGSAHHQKSASHVVVLPRLPFLKLQAFDRTTDRIGKARIGDEQIDALDLFRRLIPGCNLIERLFHVALAGDVGPDRDQLFGRHFIGKIAHRFGILVQRRHSPALRQQRLCDTFADALSTASNDRYLHMDSAFSMARQSQCRRSG